MRIALKKTAKNETAELIRFLLIVKQDMYFNMGGVHNNARSYVHTHARTRDCAFVLTRKTNSRISLFIKYNFHQLLEASQIIVFLRW